jgi:hypothetical protein
VLCGTMCSLVLGEFSVFAEYTCIGNMVSFRHFACLRVAVLFLMLVPSALSIPYHELGDEDDGE